MKAVVLARGLGTRMQAPDPGARLTHEQSRVAETGVKSMMPINGRPFLDYVLSSLADAALTEVALVVAPDHEVVHGHYDDHPPSRVRLTCVVQPEARGTADAVLSAQPWLDGDPFVCLNADNLYPVAALRDLVAAAEPALPAFERDDLIESGNIPAERIRSFAVIDVDERGYLSRIVEKPPDTRDDALVSMNCWRFDAQIFTACRDVGRSARGELELPEAVSLAVTRGARFRAIPARGPVLDLSRRSDAAELARRLSGVTPRP